MWCRRSLQLTSARLSAVGGGPVVACAAPLRAVFTRSYKTPVVLGLGPRAGAAALHWQWRSDRPRHLVLSLHAAAEGGADLAFGRLFLRPLNVAQLLVVLQGWSCEAARIERPRTTLVVEPGGAARAGAPPPGGPSSVLLRGTFTTKAPAPGGAAGLAYNDGDTRAVELRLEGEGLVLLTNHLEAVLSDCFSIEHAYHRARAREAASPRRRVPGTRYLSQQRSWQERQRPGGPPAELGSVFDLPEKTLPNAAVLPKGAPAVVGVQETEKNHIPKREEKETTLFDFDDSSSNLGVDKGLSGVAAEEDILAEKIEGQREGEVDDDDEDAEWQEEEDEDLETGVDFVDEETKAKAAGVADLPKSTLKAPPLSKAAEEGVEKSKLPITSVEIDEFDPEDIDESAEEIDEESEVTVEDEPDNAKEASGNASIPQGGIPEKTSKSSSPPMEGDQSSQRSEKDSEFDILDMQYHTMVAGAAPEKPNSAFASASKVQAQGGVDSTSKQPTSATPAVGSAPMTRSGGSGAPADAALRDSPATFNDKEKDVGKEKPLPSKKPAKERAKSESSKKRKSPKKSSRGKTTKKNPASNKKR